MSNHIMHKYVETIRKTGISKKPKYLPDTNQSEIFYTAVYHEAGILWNDRIELNVANIQTGLKEGVEAGFYPKWLMQLKPNELKKIIDDLQEESNLIVSLNPRNSRPILAGSDRAPKPTLFIVPRKSSDSVVPPAIQTVQHSKEPVSTTRLLPSQKIMTPKQFAIFKRALAEEYKELCLKKLKVTPEIIAEKFKLIADQNPKLEWLSRVSERQIQSGIDRLQMNKALSLSDKKGTFFRLNSTATIPIP